MNFRTSALCAFFLSLPIVAQEKAAPPSGMVVVSLTFAGGPLGDFVAQVRQAEPRANIVVAEGARRAQLPPIELRGAGLDQALEGICAVAKSELLIRMKEFRGVGEPVYTIMANEPVLLTSTGRPAGPTGPTGATGPTTSSGPTTQVLTAPRRDQVTEVHSLNRLLDPKGGSGFAVTTVLSAIEAAVGENQPLAALRFHKESGLLIFRGEPEQTAIVREVLTCLERDVNEGRRQDNAKKGVPTESAKQDR